MKLNGSVEFKESVEKVWDALHDVEILKAVIPGCQALDYEGDGQYKVSLKLGVAAVKGEYEGKVKLEDVEQYRHYILNAEGSGGPGHVKVQMNCHLKPTDSGGSVLDWDCDAEIGGMIASVGSRVLSGVAKFMAGKFFKDIKKHLK